MRRIGFSTGALAKGDFRRGLEMATGHVAAVELSALREQELPALLAALPTFDLSSFDVVSLHAPSRFKNLGESVVREMLRPWFARYPIVFHPDAFADFASWRPFGQRLLIENMDLRKSIGRTSSELTAIFRELPEASLCFDIGHARQIDPSMREAAVILRDHGPRLAEMHLSNVAADGRHHPLDDASIAAFRTIAIPEHVPIILETVVDAAGIASQVDAAFRLWPTAKS